MAKPDCERYLRNRRIMQQRYPSLLTAEETKNLYLVMFNGHEDRNNKHVSRLLRKSDRMIAREPELSNAGFYDAVKDVARVAQAVDFEEWARSQKVPAHIAREIRSGAPSSDVYWEWLIGEADRVWRRWMTSLDSYPGPSKVGWVSDIKNALGDVSQRPWELFVYAEPNAMSRFRQHDPHEYYRWILSGSHGFVWAITNGFLMRSDFAEHDPGALRAGHVILALEATERCLDRTESLPQRPGRSPIAITLRHPKRRDLVAMVTASASEPGRYQLTWADNDGPSGHTTRDTPEAAVRHAIEEGYRLDTANSAEARDMVERVQQERERRAAEIESWLTESLPSPRHAGRMGDGFKVGEHVIRIGDMIKMEGQLGGYVESVDRVRGTAKIEQDNGEIKPWPLASLLHDTKANRERQQEHNDKINAEAEARLELSLADWRAR